MALGVPANLSMSNLPPVNKVHELQPVGHNGKRFARPLPDTVDVPLARIKENLGPRFMRRARALVLQMVWGVAVPSGAE